MDFLDPNERKKHSIRLIIGYGLMTVLIFTATLILVYRAYGFDVDRKTGQVIQNGLVYIDSAPDKASIYINDKLQDKLTNSSFMLKEGTYKLAIKRDGYRDWTKSIELKGGDILRITYPLMLKNELTTQQVAVLGQFEKLIKTQSPDRRWIIVGSVDKPNVLQQFDLKNLDKNKIPTQTNLNFSESLFDLSNKVNKYQIIEWSNDNQHFLVRHDFGDMSEFVIFNRDRPDTSFNVNKLLSINPSKISLLDKKFDKWVLQDSSGNLTYADARRNLTDAPDSVTAFKTYGEDFMVYSKASADGTHQSVYMSQGGANILLTTVVSGELSVDVSKYSDNMYVAVASSGDKKTYIYKDPWEKLKKKPELKLAPISVFRTTSGFSDLHFSANSQYLFARDGQHFSVYDAERDKTYKFDFGPTIDLETDVSWMDSNRLLALSSKIVYYVEFDGLNQQKLVPTIGGNDSVFFDRDYMTIYTLSPSKDNPGVASINVSDIRLQKDK